MTKGVMVFVSDDDGSTFTGHDVHAAGCVYFPMLAFHDEGSAAQLRLASGPIRGPPTSDVLVAEDIRGSSRGPANTDFAHAARLPDGRIALVFARVDEGTVWVNVVRPA